MTTELSSAIERTVTLAQNGDRDDARQLLTHLWDRAQTEGDAYDRTVLCHYLADLQDDAHLELTWDLRALSAAQGLTDEILHAHQPSLSVASFLPSLHPPRSAARRGSLGRAPRHPPEPVITSDELS